MAKITENFEFTTQLPIGKKETVTILISGLYYPSQCSREYGVNFDIEEVWGGHYGENGEFVKVNNQTQMVRIAEVYEDALWNKIHEVATHHVECLTGYKTREALREPNEQLPDAFQNIVNNIFPNPDTYNTKSA